MHFVHIVNTILECFKQLNNIKIISNWNKYFNRKKGNLKNACSKQKKNVYNTII